MKIPHTRTHAHKNGSLPKILCILNILQTTDKVQHNICKIMYVVLVFLNCLGLATRVLASVQHILNPVAT
jgi:hypothetical protein